MKARRPGQRESCCVRSALLFISAPADNIVINLLPKMCKSQPHVRPSSYLWLPVIPSKYCGEPTPRSSVAPPSVDINRARGRSSECGFLFSCTQCEQHELVTRAERWGCAWPLCCSGLSLLLSLLCLGSLQVKRLSWLHTKVLVFHSVFWLFSFLHSS